MKSLPIRNDLSLSATAVALIAILSFAAALFLPVSPARGEAASELLGKLSCEEVKKLAQDAPAQLFEMWAESGTFGASSDLAKDIIDRGNIAAVLDNIGDLVTIIQGLEEAVNGDPKKVAEIFSNWLLGKVLTATGSGVPGAVWTVCTTLNDFAVALNSEILDINIRTFAQFAEKDPELLGPNRVDHFLRNFLEMDKSSGFFSNLTKKRATFLEYAREKLGQTDFPPPAEWENPENWNRVRAAASSMLRDVESEVNKRKKFRQLQGELKSQLDQLKREQNVLSTFESLRAQVNAMVCQDPPADCIAAYTATLNTLEGLILDAGDIQKTPAGTMNGLKSTIDAIDLDLDAIFQKMDQDKLKIDEYCAQGKKAFDAAQQTVNLAKIAAAETTAQVLVAGDYKTEACAATTVSEARDAALKARDAADQAARVAGSLSFLNTELIKYTAPEPADFAGAEARLSDLNQNLTALDESIRENLKKKDAFLGAMASAMQQAGDLDTKCKGAKDLGLVNAAMGRVDQVAAKIPDLRADMNTLASLQSKAGQIQTRISKLKSTEQKNRQCLSGKPDIAALAQEIQDLSETARTDLEKAMGHADAAKACYERLKPDCGPNERIDDQGNCVCKDGYEDVDGTCEKKCGANQERDGAGECVCRSGYEDVDGVCKKECGPNKERDSDGECVCKPGYEDINGNCQKECGPNQERNSDGKCACKPGYENVDGNCEKVCGPNRERDSYGECVCKPGYEDVNGNCQRECGPNQERNSDDKCVCKPGYKNVDGFCQKECGPNEVKNLDGGCVCRPGYERNDKGKCEAVSQKCEFDTDCKSGYVCQNGKCVFQKSDCRRDGCTSGYECDTKTGNCVYIKFDCRRNGCTPGYKCDTKTGKCVYIKPGCKSSSECKPGYVCEGGKCVPPFDDGYDDFTNTMGDRDDNRNQDQADRIAADQTTGGGRSGYTSGDMTQDLDATQNDMAGKCRKDSQCMPGYVCKNGVCVEKPDECAQNSDCLPGQECRHGKCVKKSGCSKSSDCPKGQTCKDGQCVAAPVQKATLSVSPANKAVVINETVDLKATYTDTDGSTKDVTAEASWSPSATFSRGAIGVYTVTASHKGLSASSQITVVQEKGMDDITVNKKIVTVTFWDHGRLEDGDMIDILINGEVVFPGITLTFAKQSRTITMNADIIVVEFKALNEGTAPPNTASISFTAVTAGKDTQTYSLKKDQSANMNIYYKP